MGVPTTLLAADPLAVACAETAGAVAAELDKDETGAPLETPACVVLFDWQACAESSNRPIAPNLFNSAVLNSPV